MLLLDVSWSQCQFFFNRFIEFNWLAAILHILEIRGEKENWLSNVISNKVTSFWDCFFSPSKIRYPKKRDFEIRYLWVTDFPLPKSVTQNISVTQIRYPNPLPKVTDFFQFQFQFLLGPFLSTRINF